MNAWRALAAAVLLLAAPVESAAAGGEVRDPRERTYVQPVRVVWSKDAIAPEKLLESKFGQVCETRFGKGAGTRLVNAGERPGLILDFGRELHGGLQLGMSPKGTPGAKLRLRFGESVSEAMSDVGDGSSATNDHALRDFEIAVPSFGTLEVGCTGFRFVRIDLATVGEVGLEFARAVSLTRPMARQGGFKCSDERLNRIFETAVRTVHLCCQDLLWDGIKRDRLVWIGDMHPEEKVVASVFGAQGIVPASLDYLAATTPPDEWMNTIGTYTLWWVRCLAEWYRYTGDKAYLEKHADYLRATFRHLEEYLTPTNTFDGLPRMFLDWPTEHNRPAVFAGVQALALMTWRDGAELAAALGDATSEARCREGAARLETQKGTLDPHGSKQAAALLALAGLRDPAEMFRDVLGRGGVKGVSTYYGYYVLEAMSAAGEGQRALDTVRDYWGAMLDVGATSFWEDFNVDWTNNCFRIDELPVPGKKDIHGDYGEFCYSGFRHSLCHGWSAGPAAWCINHILGIRPLDAGCRRVAVEPFLGDLDWAEGSLALPDGGCVSVRVEKTADGMLKTSISAPEGVEIIGDSPQKNVGTVTGAASAAWAPGEPVTTYWFGPGCPNESVALTDAWAAQLKEGGFNTIWARTPEDLDIAAKYGLRAIYCIDPKTEWAKIDLDDPAQRTALAERIEKVKDHPALYIYEHYDEAPAGMFPALARVKEFVNGIDPRHALWHNLLPTYASHKQLGVGGKDGEESLMGFPGDKIASYWEHLRLFCDIYQPELVTYDHYQFKVNGDSRKYFLNLALVQQAAAARRVPFWNGLQACTWVPGGLASPKSPRIPNVDEMRYLAHTTAAYGANGLYWYVYCMRRHDGSIAATDGTVGEKYEGVKKINREFIAFSKVLGNLDFKGAYMQGVHATGTTPYGAQALLKLSPETPYAEIKELQRLEDTTLVTRFASPDGRTYLMAVNCDYRKDRTLRVEAPFPAEKFDPATESWSPAGSSFDLALVRGGGAVLRSSLPTGWDPDVKARLDALIERNRGNPDAYAVFDFDYTTAIGDLTYLCMWRLLETMSWKTDDFAALLAEGAPAKYRDEIDALGSLAAKLKPLAANGGALTENPEWQDFARRFWALYRSLFDDMGESDIVMWRIRLFKGYAPDEMRRLVKDAIEAAQKRHEGLWRDAAVPTEKRGFAIAPEIKDLFRELREAGIAVYIVSASVKDTLLEASGPDFGLNVDPECVFGTALKLDAEGRYLPEKAEGCVKSGRKHEFIMEHIAPRHHGAEPVLAAGDSMGDYTMLTEFKNLELALLFMRNWREREMHELATSGGKVALQGRDETRGALIPECKCISP